MKDGLINFAIGTRTDRNWLEKRTASRSKDGEQFKGVQDILKTYLKSDHFNGGGTPTEWRIGQATIVRGMIHRSCSMK
jgi:hypothetical protein